MKHRSDCTHIAIGNKSNFKRRLLAICSLFILMCGGNAVHAQTPTALDYCYTNVTEKCFDSLDRAVASLKAIPEIAPTAQYLRLLDASVYDVSSGLSSYQYGYKFVPASQVFNDAYNKNLYIYNVSGNLGCTLSNTPYHPTWCASETELSALSENYLRNQFSGCTITPFQLVADYSSPYSSVGQDLTGTVFGVKYAFFYGTRTYRATKTCGTVNEVLNYNIEKLKNYECPANFISIEDYSTAAPNFVLPLMCEPDVSSAVVYSPPRIRSVVRGVNSCPTNGNPCHPTTGDKSRAEVDFDFAGRAFTRYYHSRKEFPVYGMATGWSHTYGEKMQNDSSGVPYLYSATGQYEGFKRVGASTSKHFRALNSPDRFVDTFSSGAVRFRMRDGSGEVREYGNVGLLLNIRNPENPANDVEMVYDSRPRLIGVKDNNGRLLTFTYDYNTALITKITRPDGAVVNYEYDADNNLTAADYGNNQRKLYHYHETGLADPLFINHLTGITSENGQRFGTFGYDAYGRVTSSKLHNGSGGFVATTTVNYTGANTATVNTDTGDTRSYTMDAGIYRRVTGLSDSAGNTSSTYDADSRIISKTDKLGIITQYEYVDNYMSAVNSAVGTPYARRMVMVRDVNNRLIRREYYGLSAGVQQLQRIESSVYDVNGRTSFVCEADALISSAASYVCGSLVVAPAGVRQSAITYCTATDVAATNSTCPRLGLIKTSDGPRTDVSDVMTYLYRSTDEATCTTAPSTCPYRKGDLWKITNALGHVTEYVAYDGDGRPKQMINANGVITDMEYHPRGWLTATKVRGLDNTGEFYDDAITRMDYDALGQVTKITQPDGYLGGDFINFTYDAAHRLTDITDAAGNTVHYTLDNAGNRTKEDTKDSGGNLKRSLSTVYDSLGRVQAARNAATATVAALTYDAESNIDKTIDALGRVNDQDLDPLNRLMQNIQDQGVGKVNATNKFEYDARDNLTKVIDPKSLNTLYEYNGFNDLTKQTSPDTGISSFTYDSAGNRASQTDAKLVTSTYSYDKLNRLTQVSYPANTSLSSTFIYDAINSSCAATENFAKGRLTQFVDPSGDTQYCYDRFGNMTRKRVTNNGVVSTFTFEYWRSGRLLSITYPSGMKVGYGRNNIGQVTQVTVKQGTTTKVFANNISYYPFGPLSRIEWVSPNSTTSNPASTGTMRVSAAATGGGCVPRPGGGCNPPAPTTPVIQTRIYDLDYAIQSVGGLNYTVDNQGNIKSIYDAAGGNAFDYDRMDRLNQVKNSSDSANVTSLTYDATGNRLTKTVGTTTPTETYTYLPTNHQLTNVAGATSVARLVDLNGNTKQIGTDKYFTYDDRNRMVDFRKSASVIDMQYQYNAKGERVRKYVGANTRASYSYDENGKLLRQQKRLYDQEIIWLDDMPIGVSQNGALHGILTDHLNTPRQVFLTSTQQTQWRWNAADDAFGEKPAVSTGMEFDLRFPGQMYDSESGLHHNGFRDQETSLGRYIQPDPIGLLGGISEYSYVESQPINLIDPEGLSSRRRSGNFTRHPNTGHRSTPKPPQSKYPPSAITRPNLGEEIDIFDEAKGGQGRRGGIWNSYYCLSAWCHNAGDTACPDDSSWVRWYHTDDVTVSEIESNRNCECRKFIHMDDMMRPPSQESMGMDDAADIAKAVIRNAATAKTRIGRK